jgi:hypothetical protein
MSTTLSFIGKEIIIYGGISVLVVGVLGGLLNTLVFLSLRTFRQSSCAFYLIVMSIVNVCQLCLGITPRIITALTDIDATIKSLFFCKSKLYFSQIFITTSLTCFCLATIDQYFATSTRPRWQQWCNIKLAQRVTIIAVLIWILHGIPYVVFYEHVVSSTTNQITCISTNHIFDQYRAFFIVLGLSGFIPISIAALFGSMAFRNVQEIAYRTVPLVRRELDKQLTVMVLVQVVINIFALLPYTISNAMTLNTNLTSDPDSQAKVQFASTVTLVIYYTYFAVSVKETKLKFLFDCII